MDDISEEKYKKCADIIEAEIAEFSRTRVPVVCRPGVCGDGGVEKVSEGPEDINKVSESRGDGEAEDLEPNAPTLLELEQNDSIIRDLGGDNVQSGDATRKKSRVCKHFLHKKCKHGKRGEGCNFYHPKLCFRFSKFGSKHPKGCKKGKKCDFFHPPLCWKSVDGEECERKSCKFLHIIVPKLKENIGAVATKEQTISTQPSWAHVVSGTNSITQIKSKSENRPWTVASHASEREGQRDHGNTEDFLEIRRELRDLRSLVERLMRQSVDYRGREAIGKCSCH